MKQRIIATALITASVIGALGLAGCGGAATDSSTSADVPAGQAAVADSSNQQVLGYWLWSESDVDNGISNVLYFGDDGTFEIRAQALNIPIVRAGTYTIENGKVYIDVPEIEKEEVEGEGPIASFSAKAIEHAEIVVDGDTLTTEVLGSGEDNPYKASRISEEEYEEIVAKAEALGPQEISVGETVSSDGYTFTVNSFGYQDEIYPSDTSGYYNYYPYQDGKLYLVADISYTNEGTEYASPCNSTKAELAVGENKYGASIEIDTGTSFYSYPSIDAKDSGRIIIFSAIPEAAQSETPLKLTWSFPKDPSNLNNYYTSSGKHISYVLTA